MSPATEPMRSEAYAHLTDTELEAATRELVELLDPIRPCPVCHSMDREHQSDCKCLKLKNILREGGLP